MNGIDGAEHEHCEADKDRLIAELREAVRARDEFVSIAAHELRNPMTPILLQVHRVLASVRRSDRCRSEVLAPQVEALERAVKEFLRRATALLDVSRVAAGNIRIEVSEVDLSRVAQDVVDRLAPAARIAGCAVESDLESGVVGMWDRLAVEQIAENLLSNALKFGAGRPVRVLLRADSRAARLTVQDQGIGMSKEDQRRVFGRFERAVVSREHGGVGLGLWLSNQLAQAMGGAITVESAPGEGACFTVALPFDAAWPAGGATA